MEAFKNKSFTILGGGIAGLSTAIALRRLGIQAQVLEAAAAFKPLGAGLLLAANAVLAYRKIGIAESIIAQGRRLPHFKVLDAAGRSISTVDTTRFGGKDGIHNFAIHRATLHEALLAELQPDQVIWGKRAISFSRHKNGSTDVHFEDGSTHNTDYLIVADGIHSAIRKQLLPESTERYAGYTCWRATINAGDIKQIDATESWGPAGRFGIVPLADARIYWFACVTAAQNSPGLREAKVVDLQNIFAGYHAPIPDILAQTADAKLIWSDIIDLKPISRFAFNNIVLIGDAAHATTPNMGQGACQAIEDAAVLVAEMEKQPADPVAAFRSFEQRRLKRTHFIVNNSWNLGQMAQWSKPWQIALRNSMFRMIPARINEWQMKKVLDVEL